MNWPLVYQVANLSVLPAWGLLVLLPKHPVTKAVVHSYLYPIMLGLFYLLMLATSWGGDGGMDSLEQLKRSFQRDEILVLGWVHYLVFDLFIGAWISRDAQTHHLAHLKIIPSLILTLFAGPIGLLSYLMLRAWHTRSVML